MLLPAAALLALVPTVSVRAPGAGADRPAMLWGAHVDLRNSPTELDAFIALENAAGRRFSAARVYAQWAETFPDRFEAALNADGRTLVFSMKSQRADGAGIRWAEIAAAQPGSRLYDEITRLGDQIRTFGDPMYLIFHHEPEADGNTSFGSAADFVAAWRKIVGVIRAQGAINARFLWTMTVYSFTLNPPERRAAVTWYPGDAYVDAIGADAYNWSTCRGRDEGWRSLRELIEPLRVFGALHPDKELWLPEYGSVEDPGDPGRKGQWLRDMGALFAAPGWEQFRGVTYFDDTDPATPACRWFVDTSGPSIAGFAAAGAAPVFGGVVAGPPCVNVGLSCGATATQGAIRIRRP